jgi:hypothetical protein
MENARNNIFVNYMRATEIETKGTVGRQIKLGHLKFNLCKSDH